MLGLKPRYADHQASTMDLTPLQEHIAREVIAFVREENLGVGDRLSESGLALRLGTSRSPINAALRHLADLGLLAHDRNRGFFLAQGAPALGRAARRVSRQPDDPLYLRLAADRLAHRLPDLVNETDLMRRYGASRGTLRRILSRIQQEGWIEKSAGYGWTFQPLIDSREAYEESYVFRTALEPTGLLAACFRADPEEQESLRQQQRCIADGGFETMTAIELFVANSRFHETLAKWSGNRFIHQAIRRTDQLRRLVEYRQAQQRPPRREQALEHLAILDAIARQDQLQAASLMRAHLEAARRGKQANLG